MDQQQQNAGPPYLPTTAPVGGIPSHHIDTPICAVLILLYLIGLMIHFTLFRRNLRKPSTKFRLSILIVYMCFLRLVTMAMRIAWAANTHSIRLAIAAQVFTTAGVLLLFILNVVFCQRIMRAWHPRFGWNPIVSWAFPIFYATIPLHLVAIITTLVLSLYTLNSHTRSVDHTVQLYVVTFFLVVAAFPIPFVLINYATLRRDKGAVEGASRKLDGKVTSLHPTMAGNAFRSACVVMIASGVLLIGSVFRTAVNWAKPVPPSRPAWYDSRACFYVFNFVTELVVVFFYAGVRVDRLFFVPAKGQELRESGDNCNDSTHVETKGEA